MFRNGDERTDVLDPEVVPMAERRQFTAEEKLRIVEEADACHGPGEIGALLRREGIYSSYLSRWRQARDRGELDGLSTKKRGPKRKVPKEHATLQRENKRLQARLERAEMIIEVQKKLCELLGVETSELKDIEQE